MDKLLVGYARARAESLASAAQGVKDGGWAYPAAQTTLPDVARDFYNARVLALAVEELARLVRELTAMPEPVIVRSDFLTGAEIADLVERSPGLVMDARAAVDAGLCSHDALTREVARRTGERTQSRADELMGLRLSVGKHYRTRDGRKALVALCEPGFPTRCYKGFVDGMPDDLVFCWHSDGRAWRQRGWCANGDLVAEWTGDDDARA